MKRAASIASFTLAAVLAAGPGPAAAGPEDLVRGIPLFPVPERPAVAPESAARPHARPTERRIGRKAEKPADRDAKLHIPPGLLHVVVSINKQRVTLFADGTPVTSSPVSTGTPGHPTPLGVFSIIQKRRHHVSNLYNASMPFMQRLTWSGTALHEGPLPGHPASHGCIRLSANFAQTLWKATKIGVRVIVTRDEVVPVAIDMANPFQPKPKLVQAPVRVPVQMPVQAANRAPAHPIKTADAGNAMAATTDAASLAPVVVQDTTGAMVSQPAAGRFAPAQATKAMLDGKPVGSGDTIAPAPAVTDASPASNKPATEQSTKATPDGAAVAKPAAAAIATAPATEPAQVAVDASPAANRPAAEQSTKITLDATTRAAETIAAPAPKAEPEAKTEPAASEPAASQVPAVEPAPVNFDGITPPEPQQPAADERPTEIVPLPLPAVRDARRSNEPVSVFISRKEGKLYVRQKMEPLFDAPVTFERPDQPVGTHVFTAMAAKDDGMRWTVISIPSGFKRAAEPKHKPGSAKARIDNSAHPALEPAAALPSPRSALARVAMPPDAVERISALFIPGSSIIISDNRLSDETGEYTDTIVLTP